MSPPLLLHTGADRADLAATLQQAWLALEAAQPRRLHTRFGTPVKAVKPVADGVEIDAGIAEDTVRALGHAVRAIQRVGGTRPGDGRHDPAPALSGP